MGQDESLVYFEAYPNPASASVQIDMLLSEAAELKISLHDLSGKQVAQICDKPLGQGFQHINWLRPANLPAGLYLLKVQAGSQTALKKLIFN
ncbi:MAG: T9SS type A sorting domain-containing protein [Bacteroidia bacterium]